MSVFIPSRNFQQTFDTYNTHRVEQCHSHGWSSPRGPLKTTSRFAASTETGGWTGDPKSRIGRGNLTITRNDDLTYHYIITILKRWIMDKWVVFHNLVELLEVELAPPYWQAGIKMTKCETPDWDEVRFDRATFSGGSATPSSWNGNTTYPLVNIQKTMENQHF